MRNPSTVIAVLAHNEERRIAACLHSLPLDDPFIAVHVIVNGSTDRTAERAREAGRGRVQIHDWEQGGKARSWNRFVLDTPNLAADIFIFVDGDAQILPGSVEGLTAMLKSQPCANAVAGLPRNGRRARTYQAGLTASHGMFGDLYALSGDFVARLRASRIRLPEDLIGDDGLIGAMAKTDLGIEADWCEERLPSCPEAGFICNPVRLSSPETLHTQYRRMINYSLRRFQNLIVSDVMREHGPAGLPVRMADLYAKWLPRFSPRRHPLWWWFDRLALARMRAAVKA